MNNALAFIAKHAVISTVALSILLILIGLGLIAAPQLILRILRWVLIIGNIGVGVYLLIRTIARAK